jgi:hypothetical protein
MKAEIRELADELDYTRKAILIENDDLTLTGLYNICQKMRAGEDISTKDEDVKIRGRIPILKDLHQRIDAAITRAYGWRSELTDEQIVEALVSLNAKRVGEEQRGFTRWVRPHYQINRFKPLAHRADRVQSISIGALRKPKRPFPTGGKEQASQVLRLLRRSDAPMSSQELASHFKQGNQVLGDIEDILKSLNRLGETQTYDSGRTYVRATR